MGTMDWQKETKNSPVYPVGTYHVKLESWERTVSKPTQNNPNGFPQIRWKTVILQPEEHTGRTFFDHTGLTDTTQWRTANMVDAFGVVVKSVMDTNSHAFDQVLQACVGRTAFWTNAEGRDQNQNPKNNVVKCLRDNDQEPIQFGSTEDAPDFAKG